MIKLSRLLFTPVVALVLFATALQAQGISVLPEQIERSCRGGRAALYDECGSQTKLLRQAIFHAETNGKVLLVSYGAEWCIWCHVFEQYIKGEHTTMTYRFSEPGDSNTEEVTLQEKPDRDPTAEAAALTKFVADTFVLVHIESYYASDGYDVLTQTGADETFNGGLPYIFTINAEGQYAAHLQSSTVETRRDGWIDWYRGYDRPGLMAELARMADAAR